MVRHYRFIIAGVVLFCALAYVGLSATFAFAATAPVLHTSTALALQSGQSEQSGQSGQPDQSGQNGQSGQSGQPGSRNACPPTISKGARGATVRTLQTKLNQAGFKGANGHPLPVTGTFDDQTLSAVKQFQRQHHLQPNGVVGASTWQALGVCGK